MANSVNSDSGPWIVSTRRLFLVGLVISVLTVNVGTRTFHVKTSHVVTAESSSARGMRQHLDRDATSWVVPVLLVAILRVHPLYSAVPPLNAFSSALLRQRPFDRPPPPC